MKKDQVGTGNYGIDIINFKESEETLHIGRTVYREIDLDKVKTKEDIKALLSMVLCSFNFEDVPKLKATDEMINKYNCGHLLKS